MCKKHIVLGGNLKFRGEIPPQRPWKNTDPRYQCLQYKTTLSHYFLCCICGSVMGWKQVHALVCVWALWADSMKGLWFQLGHNCNLIWYLRSRVQTTGIQGYHRHHGGIRRLSEWHSVRCCWHGNMSELLHTRLSYMHFATVLLCSVLSWPPTRIMLQLVWNGGNSKQLPDPVVTVEDIL